MDILTQKTITSFKEELFCTGDVFDIERWDVKIPRHNDDEWVPISLKEKFYAMFDHFEDHNSVLDNVQTVKNCIRYFRVIYQNGKFTDYSFKNFDFFKV